MSPSNLTHRASRPVLHRLLGSALLISCIAACGGDASDTGTGTRVPTGGSGSKMVSTGGKGAGSAGEDAFGNRQVAGAGGATGSVPLVTGGTGDPDTCARGMATATPVTPTIWLVVDGSSSMEMPFAGGMSRWETLRSTLMGPSGVVASLEKSARIGLVIYSGPVDFGGTVCPNLITVQPDLNNFMAISAAYPQMSIAMRTPTAEAMDYVVSNLPVANMQVLDAKPEPIYVVLATDGQPNGCDGQDRDAEPKVIAAVTKGTAAGMNMFVVSMAGDDNQLQSHLEQVAQATQTKTAPFVPSTQAELVSTFQTIIGGATCQVTLSGTVEDGKQCQGSVMLNGGELACDSDNGWRLSDPRTVQLTGTVCDQFRMSDSTVVADFPCDAFKPD